LLSVGDRRTLLSSHHDDSMSMAASSSSETSEPSSGLTEFRQHDFDNDDEYQVATHVRIHDDN
jgi:hypothetical protein